MRTLTLTSLIGNSESVENYDADDLSYVDGAKHLELIPAGGPGNRNREDRMMALTQEAAEEWGRLILQWFNNTLRPGDTARTFVSATLDRTAVKDESVSVVDDSPKLIDSCRPPFKGMKMVKGTTTRLVVDVGAGIIDWKNINAKKPKLRKCSEKAWNRWVLGRDGVPAKELIE
jgi:hypothetical protein